MNDETEKTFLLGIIKLYFPSSAKLNTPRWHTLLKKMLQDFLFFQFKIQFNVATSPHYSFHFKKSQVFRTLAPLQVVR